VHEVRDELRVDPVIIGLLAVNRKPADPAQGHDHPVTEYIFGATVAESSNLRPVGKKVRDYAFLPPAEAVQGIDVSAAMKARRSEKTQVLEDGKPPKPPAQPPSPSR
jgi:hypothetical protein